MYLVSFSMSCNSLYDLLPIEPVHFSAALTKLSGREQKLSNHWVFVPFPFFPLILSTSINLFVDFLLLYLSSFTLRQVFLLPLYSSHSFHSFHSSLSCILIFLSPSCLACLFNVRSSKIQVTKVL